MPPDLDINRDLPLDGTMPTYAEHVVINTGRSDWHSRIEDDEGLPIVKKLKEELGRGGRYSNPFHNVMVTTSSSSSPTTDTITSSSHSVSLFPSYKHFPSLTLSTLDSFIRHFILPTTLSDHVPPSSRAQLLRAAPPLPASLRAVTAITVPHIQICGHGGRDSRCGTMGPILASEFTSKLKKTPNAHSETTGGSSSDEDAAATAEISLISHIGGHKFAGNVIIYIPPSTVPAFSQHPLAGKGVWYGRVEPRHVEGIVKETLGKGVIIKEFFRGGIGEGGEVLRI